MWCEELVGQPASGEGETVAPTGREPSYGCLPPQQERKQESPAEAGWVA